MARGRSRPAWLQKRCLYLAFAHACIGLAAAASSAPSGRFVAPKRPDWLDSRSRRDRRRLRRAKDVESTSLILPQTDLSDSHKRIWIVTTASLPWMTGTSINPLLRAAYLTRGRLPGTVTLMVPFLEPEDQPKVFPPDTICDTPQDQADAVRAWLARAGLEDEARRLRIVFYPGRYHKNYGSIFPMGDISAAAPLGEGDVCILEEPEHLTWYRAPGPNWRKLFPHVVGVVHTNYLAYSSGYSVWAPVLTFLLRRMNVVMGRAYCNRIIKLSAVIQEIAPEKEVVSNVHGVREDFLKVGDKYMRRKHAKGAYFIGKSLWAKGHGRLLWLWHKVRQHHPMGHLFEMDIYGSGPDKEDIEKTAKRWALPVKFYPAVDHARLEEYKVFVNPSVSEVLCTTVAEALAMGKWVVCSDHVSNHFFYQFPNCLTFQGPEEFAACVSWALKHEPTQLTPEQRYLLTWSAATDRLVAAVAVTAGQWQQRKSFSDGFCSVAHGLFSRGRIGDFNRLVAGAENCSGQVKYMREHANLPPRDGLMVPLTAPVPAEAEHGETAALGSSRGPGRPDGEVDEISREEGELPVDER